MKKPPTAEPHDASGDDLMLFDVIAIVRRLAIQRGQKPPSQSTVAGRLRDGWVPSRRVGRCRVVRRADVPILLTAFGLVDDAASK